MKTTTKSQTQSQCAALLELLQKGEKITDLIALKKLDCRRLSARIFDLRIKGHDIKTEMITLKNKKQIAVYSMA